MRDPYEVLGVGRRASASEIKAAYRRLAKEFHPDRSPGDAQRAERFREISAAYSFLSNERMRRRYDAGEIDAEGRRRRFGNWEVDDAPGHDAWKAGFARDGQPGAAGANGRAADEFHFRFGWSEREEAFRSQSIFSELFGNLRGAPRLRRRGPDTTYRLNVSFEEAMCGATRRVRLPSGRRLDVRIPPGAETGQHIRLKGEGEPGPQGGKPGDALIVLQVEPHALFRREGQDIHMDLDVGVAEAVLGATVAVPTIHGPVTAAIPPGSNSGALLRLEGKGVVTGDGRAGDHIAALRVILPGPEDQAFTDFIRRWARDRAEGHAGSGGGVEPAPHGYPIASEE